ncbi:MAG: hypothetical protein ACON5B_04690 [Myxococcota bacterium]
MRMTHLLLLPALSSCMTTAVCNALVDEAEQLALADASDCRFAPQQLTEAYCAGDDASPLLGYHASFCADADAECIDATYETVEACVGRPEEWALARIAANAQDGDWVASALTVVTSIQRESRGVMLQSPDGEALSRGLLARPSDGGVALSVDDRVALVGRAVRDVHGRVALEDAVLTPLGPGRPVRPLVVDIDVAASGAWVGRLLLIEGLEMLAPNAACPDEDCDGEALWATNSALLVSDRAFEGPLEATPGGSGVVGVLGQRGTAYVVLPRTPQDLGGSE